MTKYELLMTYDAGFTGTEVNVKVIVTSDKPLEKVLSLLVDYAYEEAIQHAGLYCNHTAEAVYDEVLEETGDTECAEQAYLECIEQDIGYHACEYVEAKHEGLITFGCNQQNILELEL